MSDWFLYLVRCKNNSLYTGITTDVERRFKQHQSGNTQSAKYLRGKGPLRLVFVTGAGNRSEASQLEARVKKLSVLDKNKLIEGKLLPSDIFKTIE